MALPARPAVVLILHRAITRPGPNDCDDLADFGFVCVYFVYMYVCIYKEKKNKGRKRGLCPAINQSPSTVERRSEACAEVVPT